MENEIYEYEESEPQYPSTKFIEIHPFNLSENRSHSMNYNLRNNTSNYSSDRELRMSSKQQAKQSLKNSRSFSKKSQKYEYGSKIREKRNYVYYVSGVGYVTKNDEQKKNLIKPNIIEIPKTEKPKVVLKTVAKNDEDNFVQIKKVIDNYQYHETKNIKKGKKKSNVFHQRLSKPFEYMEQIRSKKSTPYSTLQINTEYSDDENNELSYNRNNSYYLKTNPSYQESNYRNSKYIVHNKRIQTPVSILKNRYQNENIIQPKEFKYEEVYENKENNFPKFESKYQTINYERSENNYNKENYGYKSNINNKILYNRIIGNQNSDGEDEINYRFRETKNVKRGNSRRYRYKNYDENNKNSKGFIYENSYQSYKNYNNFNGNIGGRFQKTRELICPVHGTKVIIKTEGEY